MMHIPGKQPRDSRLRGKDGKRGGNGSKDAPPNPLILNLLKDGRNDKACQPIPIPGK